MHEPRVLQEPSHFPLAPSDQFEIKPTRRDAITEWIKDGDLGSDDRLFPSRVHDSSHRGTIKHTRILDFGSQLLFNYGLFHPTSRWLMSVSA